jgi:hypothetical protein
MYFWMKAVHCTQFYYSNKDGEHTVVFHHLNTYQQTKQTSLLGYINTIQYSLHYKVYLTFCNNYLLFLIFFFIGKHLYEYLLQYTCMYRVYRYEHINIFTALQYHVKTYNFAVILTLVFAKKTATLAFNVPEK